MADELKRAFGLEGERALITGGGTALGSRWRSALCRQALTL